MIAFWKRGAKPSVKDHGAAQQPAATRAVTPEPTIARASFRRGVPSAILVRPHLTEKSSVLAERGQYTFVVASHAEKVSIARAVAARYGVHPTRVAIVRLPG